MKYLLLPIVALGIGIGAASAAPTAPAGYPPCSKTVTDKCVAAAPTPHKMAAKHAKASPRATHRTAHRASHRATHRTTHRTAHRATPKKTG